MFIKIGLINYFVENLEIGPDSETLIVVIAEKQWPWVSIPKHPGFEDEDLTEKKSTYCIYAQIFMKISQTYFFMILNIFWTA